MVVSFPIGRMQSAVIRKTQVMQGVEATNRLQAGVEEMTVSTRMS